MLVIKLARVQLCDMHELRVRKMARSHGKTLGVIETPAGKEELTLLPNVEV